MRKFELYHDSYAWNEQEKHPGFKHRKPRFNQRTGKQRHVYHGDDYGKPHHMSFCGLKQTAICIDCEYSTRVLRVNILPSYLGQNAVENHKIHDGQKCPHCSKELVLIGQKLRLPKKGKWKSCSALQKYYQ